MSEYDEEAVGGKKSIRQYSGLERLICMALSDQHFTQQLLNEPDIAIAQRVALLELSAEEYMLATAIHSAKDLHDYAAQLYSLMLHRKQDPQS